MERDFVIPYEKNLKDLAKSLRSNLTEAERCLWKRLRLKHLGYAFYRQKPIGDYIVDFYCPKARLVVEVDGGQHFNEDNARNDKIRDEYMLSLGLTILRFSNSEVLEYTDSIAEAIYGFLDKILPIPPLQREKREAKSTKILLIPPLRKGDKRSGKLEGRRVRKSSLFPLYEKGTKDREN
jgi:very-short-patch-repair endonuclease